MRQEDVLLTLRSGGAMTPAQITEALALDATVSKISNVRTKLRKLCRAGLVRPVRTDPETNRVEWEAVA